MGGHSSSVEYQLPKLRRRVRFPLPAPKRSGNFRKKIAVPFWFFSFLSFNSFLLSQIDVPGEKIREEINENVALHRKALITLLSKTSSAGNSERAIVPLRRADTIESLDTQNVRLRLFYILSEQSCGFLTR